MDEDRAKLEAAAKVQSAKGAASKPNARLHKNRKRVRLKSSDESDSSTESLAIKRAKTGIEHVRKQDVEETGEPVFRQPALVTGAKLKNYQLEGLQWMVSLDQNGISGILGI